MAYVDLNPVRAGVAEDLAGSKHTSIHCRLAAPATDPGQPLREVAGPATIGFLSISEADYIRLVDWTGRQLKPGKRGLIAGDTPPALPGHVEAERWLGKVSGIESRFCRAIGSAQALLDKAQEIGQRWLMVRRIARLPM